MIEKIKGSNGKGSMRERERGDWRDIVAASFITREARDLMVEDLLERPSHRALLDDDDADGVRPRAEFVELGCPCSPHGLTPLHQLVDLLGAPDHPF